MTRITRCLLLGGLAALVCAAVAAPPAPAGGEKAGSSPLRIGLNRGMFRHVPEAMFPVLAGPFRRLMLDHAGLSGDLQIVADAPTLASQIDSGGLHAGVFSGHEFACLKVKYPELQALIIAQGREERPTAVLIVRKDSPAKSLDDLKGQPIALARDARDFCRIYLDHGCPTRAKAGEPNDYADALEDTIDRKYAAAVVDGGSFSYFQEANPRRAALLRVAAKSEPFPAGVVACRRGVLDESIIQRFQNGLAAARNSQQGRDLMRLWKMRGFEPVPADYEKQLADVRKAYPPVLEVAVESK